MMRVLHILDQSLPLHSGYTFRTAAIMRAQMARGWQPLALTTPRQGITPAAAEQVEDWTFNRTLFAPSWLSRWPGIGAYVDEMLATARRLAQLVRVEKPDILHAHSPVLTALPALWVARRAHLPMVYEVRACWEDAAVDHGSTREGSLRYWLTRRLETAVARHVDALTVICDGLRNEFENRGIEPSKITVIPNAVDVDQFRLGLPRDERARRDMGLAGSIVIGFVGSFYGYEGLDLLLRAFSRLRPRRPDLRVLLVGAGYQFKALQQLASELGVDDAVIFTGRVPHAQVQRYYEQIDLLVYPRRSMRLTELVTPLKPLEAMAQGKILLASNVGGHRELVRDGDTGYLFEAGSTDALGQAIDVALSRRDEWDAMRQRARRFVESERTWALSVARYAPIYERLVEGGTPVPATHVAGR